LERLGMPGETVRRLISKEFGVQSSE